MLTLAVIGFLGGLITSISPCVLPVLPVALAAGTSPQGRSWRPYGVVAGLVVSFSVSTLFGSIVLSALHLPQDLLRDAGIVILVVVGLGLVFRQVGDLLERPFVRLTGRPVNPNSNGLVVGLGAGLLFVPCAGPVLATIAVVGATHKVGFSAVVLTVAFGVGVGVPLLVLAVAGDALSRRTGALRRHAIGLRRIGGVVMIVIAAAIGFNLTDGLQRNVPGYTTALQNHVEANKAAAKQLSNLATGKTNTPGSNTAQTNTADSTCTEGGTTLEDCGRAPEITGINAWLNTPGDKPLTLAGLRGKVVLIDFWTYSCINCQRTLPHVEGWYRAYQSAGLEIIGVHTPEFAFEHVASNVAAQSRALGVKYPIAIDNDYATWNAFGNQYWPAEYLVDASGIVRHVTFGEGDYDGTEALIRQLLAAADPQHPLAASIHVTDTTPVVQSTPETYLGHEYQLNTTGPAPTPDKDATYTFPTTLNPDTFALSGTWNDGAQALTAGANAKLELSYQAGIVYLVLGGDGTVAFAVNGVPQPTLHVAGVPKLYTLVNSAARARATLTLTVSAGVQAYDFTFG